MATENNHDEANELQVDTASGFSGDEGTTPPQSPVGSIPTLVGITVPEKEDWSGEFDLSKPLVFRSGLDNLGSSKGHQFYGDPSSAPVNNNDRNRRLSEARSPAGDNIDDDLDWAAGDVNGTDQVYSRYLRRGSVHFDTDDNKWQAFKANRQEEAINSILRSLSQKSVEVRDSSEASTAAPTVSKLQDEKDNVVNPYQEGVSESNAHGNLKLNLVSLADQLNSKQSKDSDKKTEQVPDGNDSESSFEDWDKEFENEYTSSEAGESATTPLGMATPISQQQKAFHAQIEGLRSVLLQDDRDVRNDTVQHKTSGVSFLPPFHQLSSTLKRRRPNPTIVRYPRSTELYSLRTDKGVKSLSESVHDKMLSSLGQSSMPCSKVAVEANAVIKNAKRTMNKFPLGSIAWCGAFLESCRVYVYATQDYSACTQQVNRYFNQVQQHTNELKKQLRKSAKGQATPSSPLGDHAHKYFMESGPCNGEESQSTADIPRWVCLLETGLKLIQLYAACLASGVLDESNSGALAGVAASDRRSWIPSTLGSGATSGAKPAMAKYFKILLQYASLIQETSRRVRKPPAHGPQLQPPGHVVPATGVVAGSASALRCLQAESVLHMLTVLPAGQEHSRASHRPSKSTVVGDLYSAKLQFVRSVQHFGPLRSATTPFLAPEPAMLEAAIGQLCVAYADADQLANRDQLGGGWVDSTHPDSVRARVLCDLQLLLFGICPLTLQDEPRLHELLEDIQCAVEEAAIKWDAGEGMGPGDPPREADVTAVVGAGFIHLAENGYLEGPGAGTPGISVEEEPRADEPERTPRSSIDSSSVLSSRHSIDMIENDTTVWRKLCCLDPGFRMSRLLEMYPTIRKDSPLKAKAAYTLAQYFLRVQGNSEKAEQLLFEALFVLHRISSGNNQPLARAFGVKLLREYGEVLVENQKYKFAIASLESALLLHQSVFRVEDHKLVRKLCGICVDHLDWDRAIRYHFEVLGTCAASENVNEYVYVAERIAVILMDNKADFGRAIRVLEDAIRFLQTKSLASVAAARGAAVSSADVGSASRLHRRSTAHPALQAGTPDRISKNRIRRWTGATSRSSSTSPTKIRGRSTTSHVDMTSSRASGEAVARAISTGTRPASNPLQGSEGLPRECRGQQDAFLPATLTSHELGLYVKLEMKLVHVLLCAFRIPECVVHVCRALSRSHGSIPRKHSATLYLLLARVANKADWVVDCRDALENAAKLWDDEWSPLQHNSVTDELVLNSILRGEQDSNDISNRDESSEKPISDSVCQELARNIRAHLVQVQGDQVMSYVSIWVRCLLKQRLPGLALVWLIQLLGLAGVDSETGVAITDVNLEVVLGIGQIGKLFFYFGKVLHSILEAGAPLFSAMTDTFAGSPLPSEQQKPEYKVLVLRRCVKSYWNANQYFGVVNDTMWQAKTLARVAQVELHMMIEQETSPSKIRCDNEAAAELNRVPGDQGRANELNRVTVGERAPSSPRPPWWLQEQGGESSDDVAVRVQRYEQPCLLSADICADSGYPPLMIRCLLNMVELLLLEDDLDRAREYWAEASILLCSFYLTSGSVRFSPAGRTLKSEMSELWVPCQCPTPATLRRLGEYVTRLLRAAALRPVLVHSTTMHRRLVATQNWLHEQYYQQQHFRRTSTRALEWQPGHVPSGHAPSYLVAPGNLARASPLAVAVITGSYAAFELLPPAPRPFHRGQDAAKAPGSLADDAPTSSRGASVESAASPPSSPRGRRSAPALKHVDQLSDHGMPARVTVHTKSELAGIQEVPMKKLAFVPIPNQRVRSWYHRVWRLTFADMGTALRVQEVREQNQILLRKIQQSLSAMGTGAAAVSPRLALCHSPSNAAALLGANRDSPVAKSSPAASSSLSPMRREDRPSTADLRRGSGKSAQQLWGPWHQSGAAMLFTFGQAVGSLAFGTKSSAPWATRLFFQHQRGLHSQDPEWLLNSGGPEPSSCPPEWATLLSASLGISSTLDVVSSLLGGRSAVVVSSFPDVCEHSVRCLMDLLQPLEWRDVCIPFLPAPIVHRMVEDLLKSRSKFVLGIHPNHLPFLRMKISQLEEALCISVVNVDRGSVKVEGKAEASAILPFPGTLVSLIEEEIGRRSRSSDVGARGAVIQQGVLGMYATVFQTLPLQLQDSSQRATALDDRGIQLQTSMVELREFNNWISEQQIFKELASRIWSCTSEPTEFEKEPRLRSMWTRLVGQIDFMRKQVTAVQSKPLTGWLTIMASEVGKPSKGSGFTWTASRHKPKKKWCVLDVNERTLTYYYGKSKTKEKGIVHLHPGKVWTRAPTYLPFGNVFDKTMCLTGPNRPGEETTKSETLVSEALSHNNAESWFIVDDNKIRIAIQPSDEARTEEWFQIISALLSGCSFNSD